jgi:putative hydrolase of the HAD superfamily
VTIGDVTAGAPSNGTRPLVRAIAFDWGGVFTVGTFDGRAVTALSALVGLDERIVGRAYYPLMEHFEAGAFDLPRFHELLQDELAVEADEAEFRTAFLGAALERSAMYDVLAAIPHEYGVAMLSNNVAELCDRVRLDPRMARFEHFVFSNEIGVRKPDTPAFTVLSEALGVAPDATVFIDDNETNIAACRALGFHGILLDSPESFAAQWRALLPPLAHLVEGPAWSS